VPYCQRPQTRVPDLAGNTIPREAYVIITDKEIGKRIKGRRIELGISQKTLAEVVGVTYQQVQRYEKGTNKLNAEKIQLIAHTLSLPVSYFFESDEARMISKEEVKPCLPTQDGKLLRYFKKIQTDSGKNLVIQVARFAARAKK